MGLSMAFSAIGIDCWHKCYTYQQDCQEHRKHIGHPFSHHLSLHQFSPDIAIPLLPVLAIRRSSPALQQQENITTSEILSWDEDLFPTHHG